MSAFCFGVGKGHVYLYRSLGTHTAYGADAVQLRKYLGGFHLSGMSNSVLFILWLETDQPNFLHVDTSHGVKKSIRMRK